MNWLLWIKKVFVDNNFHLLSRKNQVNAWAALSPLFVINTIGRFYKVIIGLKKILIQNTSDGANLETVHSSLLVEERELASHRALAYHHSLGRRQRMMMMTTIKGRGFLEPRPQKLNTTTVTMLAQHPLTSGHSVGLLPLEVIHDFRYRLTGRLMAVIVETILPAQGAVASP